MLCRAEVKREYLYTIFHQLFRVEGLALVETGEPVGTFLRLLSLDNGELTRISVPFVPASEVANLRHRNGVVLRTVIVLENASSNFQSGYKFLNSGSRSGVFVQPQQNPESFYVSGLAAEVHEVLESIRALDRKPEPDDVAVQAFSLANIQAMTARALLLEWFDEEKPTTRVSHAGVQQASSDRARAPVIVADPDGNRLLVRGTEAQVKECARALRMLDDRPKAAAEDGLETSSISLEYTSAVEIGGILSTLFGRDDRRIRITTLQHNNVVTLRAPTEIMNQMKNTLKVLDVPAKAK
jgi:type II secretory pathway component GspD/PulD (secretin)